MTEGLPISRDVASLLELRRLAGKARRRRTAHRMLAIANALEGMSRADAARAVGMERQSLRDAVLRFNADGLAGLADLCRFIEARFKKTMCPQSMSRVVRRLGLSRQKARPAHPQRNAKAAEAFAKGGSSRP